MTRINTWNRADSDHRSTHSRRSIISNNIETLNVASPPLVELAGLAKSFGATRALRDATFGLEPGEVHALAGENGSGKSTLVKILSGVHAPDAGTIALAGRPAPALRTPKIAQRCGVMTVFQEILVAEARSVLENVWLGADGLVRSRVSDGERAARAGTAIEELLGHPLKLSTPVEELSLSDRQACGIVRALLRSPRVLILDEATSSLDVATRDRLFKILRRLAGDGVGTIFITHRMDEITEIADRVTVLRSGRTVATLARGEWTPDTLARLMSGSEQLTEHIADQKTATAQRVGATVLRTRDLRLAAGRAPISVEIRAGELVGLAGLEGHGQDDFLEALRGSGHRSGGDVLCHTGDAEVAIRSTQESARQQIAYVPRERGNAVFSWMSIRENFGMPTLASDAPLGWLQPRRTIKRLAAFVARLGIVLRDPADRITTLSGGNQQKVVIARWLAARPKVLLLNDPTRGIDIGAKRDLYQLLARLVDDGVAVVMLSSELDEHVELMDRVLVFREQQLTREIARGDLSRHALVTAFFGEPEAGDDGH